MQAALTRGPFGVQVYWTQTGKGFDTQNPFGTHPSYLDMMQVSFNTAGEKVFPEEVEEALKHTDMVVIPVGSNEQHGPHMVLGKHNVRVRASIDGGRIRLGGRRG